MFDQSKEVMLQVVESWCRKRRSNGIREREGRFLKERERVPERNGGLVIH